uniref:CUB domain-containing protein n=1 Tax=Oncorhynchus tshawytscha TaxID=74940 RepID=A0AAZ3SEB0_ONCTS
MRILFILLIIIFLTMSQAPYRPGFPDSPYPPNTDLAWRLHADQGYKVQLEFDTFNLEDDSLDLFSLFPCNQGLIKPAGSRPHVLRVEYPFSSAYPIKVGGYTCK